MRTERLVPLALPRGQKLHCELCLGPATLRCGGCGVTYYCDVEHQNADWVSVHERICQLLIPLRTALPFYNSEKERKHGQEQKICREKFLAEVTRTAAQNFLFEGKHEDAIPAALHSLKFSISVYGSNSVELVPAYLILAEASLGLEHLAQGEEYLSQAHWIVLKNPHCSSAVQSNLHRNLGLLHAAKGNYEDALYHLANDDQADVTAGNGAAAANFNQSYGFARVAWSAVLQQFQAFGSNMCVQELCWAGPVELTILLLTGTGLTLLGDLQVYFASCAYGTDDVAVSGGHFHMANVFVHQNMLDVANSLYSEVVEIWLRHLGHLIDIHFQAVMKPAELDVLSDEEEPLKETLDEKQRAEATQMLNAILEIRERSPRPQPAKLAKVLHALAMLHYLTQDVAKAHELVMKVQQITQQLPKYTPDESFYHLIKLMKSKPIYAK